MILSLGLAACTAGLSWGADVSMHALGRKSGLPDTGQTTSHTATFGEDNDYAPASTQPSYTVYNPVGISSVTADNRTGLMWIHDTNTDAAIGGTYTWENAITTCEGLSYATYTDWRLPNVKELFSILKYEGSSPLIDATAFIGTVTNYYWSSTTYVGGAGSAMTVNFDTGYVATDGKGNPVYIRCVRAGP